jgi:flavorubredoxin
MLARKIKERIYWMGAVDWDRRLFDSLIPLPDGTTYNAYLVEGSEKTALLDTVDPPMAGILMAQLDKVPKIDFLVSHHAEQDHSGAIPRVLDRFPEAKVNTRGRLYHCGRWRNDIPRRQDTEVHSHALGPLAGDHGNLSGRGPYPLQL